MDPGVGSPEQNPKARRRAKSREGRNRGTGAAAKSRQERATETEASSKPTGQRTSPMEFRPVWGTWVARRHAPHGLVDVQQQVAA